MKNLTFTLFLFIINLSIKAQCPPSGQLLFKTQVELDQFLIDFPNCTAIDGWIVIGIDAVDSDITSLAALSNITTISSTLLLKRNPILTSLDGLNALTSIGGTFQSFRNNGLQNFSGLENLSSIGEDIYIYCNNQITDLSGLSGLTSFSGKLTIHTCPNFQSFEGISSSLTTLGALALLSSGQVSNLTGLENITSIAGGLTFGYNDNLTSVAALSNCTIGTSLFFNGNSALNSLSGLEGTTYLSEYLIIEENHNLTDLQGLNNLMTVDGRINITDNNNLTSLDGLNSISGTVGQFYIRDNPLLEDISAVLGLTETTGICLFYNCPRLINLEGLNNLESVGSLDIRECLLIPNLNPLANLQTSDLGIHLWDNASLVSLSGLSNIHHLLDLNISDNDNLTSLTGLDNLETVTNGLFRIWNNDALVDITALNRLKEVGVFHIYYNHALLNLDGLDSLHTVQAHFYITGNSSLEDLHALAKLESINGNLGVSSNDVLIDLHGLEGVTTVQDVVINDNNSLISLTGLNNLSTVRQNFGVNNNPVLVDVSALGQVTSVGRDMYWQGNSILQTLYGMNEFTIGNKLTILSNNQLAFCSVEGICNHLENGGDFEILINATGCFNYLQILHSCAIAAAALPVDLSFFSATAKNKSVILKWTTANEEDNRGFDILKRDDFSNWQNIGWVDGIGNSTIQQEYQFWDNNPFDGNNYYKLVQLDYNGKIIESKIETAHFLSPEPINLFPNPISDMMYIKGPENENSLVTIKFYNITGKKILDIETMEKEINLSFLESGYYNIVLELSGIVSNHKIIKL